MNSFNGTGRMAVDPELRYTNSNRPYSRFTLAITRNFKNEDGKYEADFISCIAWNSTAETLCKYVKKGNRIGISGRLQTGKYEREDGSTSYTTDVIVNNMEFLESKRDDRSESEYTGPVEEKEEEEDPFAKYGETVEIGDDFLD